MSIQKTHEQHQKSTYTSSKKKRNIGRIFGAATPPGALASFASHEFESRADDGDKYSTAHKALKQYTVQRLDSLAAGDAIDRSLN